MYFAWWKILRHVKIKQHNLRLLQEINCFALKLLHLKGMFETDIYNRVKYRNEYCRKGKLFSAFKT